MARGKRIDNETKLKAVAHSQKHGCTAAAKKYNVGKSSISRWRHGNDIKPKKRARRNSAPSTRREFDEEGLRALLVARAEKLEDQAERLRTAAEAL